MLDALQCVVLVFFAASQSGAYVSQNPTYLLLQKLDCSRGDK